MMSSKIRWDWPLLRMRCVRQGLDGLNKSKRRHEDALVKSYKRIIVVNYNKRKSKSNCRELTGNTWRKSLIFAAY